MQKRNVQANTYLSRTALQIGVGRGGSFEILQSNRFGHRQFFSAFEQQQNQPRIRVRAANSALIENLGAGERKLVVVRPCQRDGTAGEVGTPYSCAQFRDKRPFQGFFVSDGASHTNRLELLRYARQTRLLPLPSDWRGSVVRNWE